MMNSLFLLLTWLLPFYPWLPRQPQPATHLAARFAPPPGCHRVAVAAGSWGEWLRSLPLLPAGSKVHLHDGRLKDNQAVVAAVVNLDVGPRDLQQCADAVMRLRAEYLYTQDPNRIHFHLASGPDSWYSDYLADRGADRATLRTYLAGIFAYAGTTSLGRDLYHVLPSEAQPGDVLLYAGRPGHAVLVVDVAEDAQGQRYLLLAQSYMPAQQVHVLRNVGQPQLGAWFEVPPADATEFDAGEYVFAPPKMGRFL